jgi:hypothetical protein
MPRFIIVLIIMGASFNAASQVNQVKSASRSGGGSRDVGGGSSGGGSFAADLVFNLMFGNMVAWQQHTLEKRYIQRQLISVDGWAQGGGQASGYYIINPRMRANWGLFSTDYRMNYLLEEDFSGVKMISTSDWQILQLNIVTARDVTFRIGGGVVRERYEGERSFPEWTAGFQIHPFEGRLGGMVEYRGCEARQEVNGHIRYTFAKGELHPYLLAGVIYQRYYSQVSVGGFQAGIGVSFY